MSTEQLIGYYTRKELLDALGIATADDPKLAALASLSWGGNAGKVLAVNATDNGWALVEAGGGGGNADSATVLQTARTIGISGKATGTPTSFNGSANITIPITAVSLAAGDIPNIAQSQVTNLTTALAAKANTASPTFTGTVTTAAVNANDVVTSSGFRDKGSYVARFEGVGAAVPPGSTGPGFELYASGGIGYLQAYNRSTAAFIPIHIVTPTVAFPSLATTASAANAFLDSGASNRLLRSTSSRKYKKDIRALKPSEADALLKLRPVAYRSKADADDARRVHWGFIAEEAAKHIPALVHYADGEPDGFQYERVVVGLLDIIKRMDARIAKLERG